MDMSTQAIGNRMLGRLRPRRQWRAGYVHFSERHDGSMVAVPCLESYYDQALDQAPPPITVDWSAKAIAAIQQVYGNDQQGDCVIASALHQVGLWTGNESGTPALSNTSEALSTYHKWCGAGDNGCDIAAVLDKTKTSGIPVNGTPHKIDGYVSVDNTNKNIVMVAIDLFGSLKLGIDLPQAWMDAADGGLWDVTTTRIIGGHDVPCIGYDADGVWIATWGGKRKITWSAFLSKKWITECYAVLGVDWYSKDNLAPNGIDVTALKADLAALGGGTVPPIPDPNPPPAPLPPLPPPPPDPNPVPPPSGQQSITYAGFGSPIDGTYTKGA